MEDLSLAKLHLQLIHNQIVLTTNDINIMRSSRQRKVFQISANKTGLYATVHFMRFSTLIKVLEAYIDTMVQS